MCDRIGKRSILGRAAALVLACAIGATHVQGAWAQSDEERAGARAAATEGAQAFGKQRWAEAADLFSRAESLVHAPPHLLYMARAHVHLGRLVKAQEEYLKITRENLAPTAPKAFQDAQGDAAKELKELEPRVPQVKAVVKGGEGRTLILTVDGEKVPAALIGVQRPIDPGEHRFQAMAEGLVSDVLTQTIREGTKETVTLFLKPGTPPIPIAGTAPPGGSAPGAATSVPSAAPTAAPAASVATAGTGTTVGADTTVPPSGGGGGLRAASFVVLGLGAVGLGVAAVFASKASSKHKESDTQFDAACGMNSAKCDAETPAIRDLEKQANDAKSLANIGLIAGGVGVAAGVTLLLLSGGGGSSSTGQPAASLTPWIGPASAGLSGKF
jgi:hypothetical protein